MNYKSALQRVLPITLATFLCPIFVVVSSAQPNKDLDVVLTASKVIVQADGTEVLQAADQSKPGETLQYTAIYKNIGGSSLQGLNATLPIPDGTVYLAESAKPAKAMASTDSVHFAPIPLKRTVKDKEGKERVELVPLAEYRKLRWSFDKLPPGESVTVSARARLTSSTEAKATTKPSETKP